MIYSIKYMIDTVSSITYYTEDRMSNAPIYSVWDTYYLYTMYYSTSGANLSQFACSHHHRSRNYLNLFRNSRGLRPIISFHLSHFAGCRARIIVHLSHFAHNSLLCCYNVILQHYNTTVLHYYKIMMLKHYNLRISWYYDIRMLYYYYIIVV